MPQDLVTTDAGRLARRMFDLPADLLSDLIDAMTRRGLIEDESRFTPVGRETKDRIEALTDELAAAPYAVLDPDEVEELVGALEPLAGRLVAAQDRG